MTPPALLMDNHKGAFLFWKSLGISGAACLHVDAHLDVSNFQIPEPGDVAHADLNCGNFLYSALQEGTITHLVWILPPHLFAARDPGTPSTEPSLLAWARHELPRWMWLTVDESKSLRQDGTRVEGTLVGARLTLCTFDDVPWTDLAGPLLVDIDVDYFFDFDDTVWQSPLTLCERLSVPKPQAITVASSVEGGYTPPHYRCLADICLLALTGRAAEAAALWQGLERAPPGADGVEESAPLEAPAWWHAARHAIAAHRTRGGYDGAGWEAAAALDPAYRIRPLDVASFYIHRKDYVRCLQWLERVEGDEELLAARYLRGLVGWRQHDHAAAEAAWGALADLPASAVGGAATRAASLLRAHVLEMRGKAQAAQGRDLEALSSFEAALKLAPQRAALWRQLAHSQGRAGLADAAARSWRRAVALAPDDVATLEARWELAHLYVVTGQVMLALGELRRIISRDDGPLGAKARLMSLQLELR